MSQPALIVIDVQNDYFPTGAYPLHDTQAVAPVGHVGKFAHVGDAQLHIMHIVETAASIEDLVDNRPGGVGNVENHQAL